MNKKKTLNAKFGSNIDLRKIDFLSQEKLIYIVSHLFVSKNTFLLLEKHFVTVLFIGLSIAPLCIVDSFVDNLVKSSLTNHGKTRLEDWVPLLKTF